MAESWSSPPAFPTTPITPVHAAAGSGSSHHSSSSPAAYSSPAQAQFPPYFFFQITEMTPRESREQRRDRNGRYLPSDGWTLNQRYNGDDRCDHQDTLYYFDGTSVTPYNRPIPPEAVEHRSLSIYYTDVYEFLICPGSREDTEEQDMTTADTLDDSGEEAEEDDDDEDEDQEDDDDEDEDQEADEDESEDEDGDEASGVEVPEYDWIPLTFDHFRQSPTRPSIMTAHGAEPRLDTAIEGNAWVKWLFPNRYHPKAEFRAGTDPSYGVLYGELGLLIALLAYSVSRPFVDWTLRSCITNRGWTVPKAVYPQFAGKRGEGRKISYASSVDSKTVLLTK